MDVATDALGGVTAQDADTVTPQLAMLLDHEIGYVIDEHALASLRWQCSG